MKPRRVSIPAAASMASLRKRPLHAAAGPVECAHNLVSFVARLGDRGPRVTWVGDRSLLSQMFAGVLPIV